MADFVCKSCFCVINNPRYEIIYEHDKEGNIIKDDYGKPVILSQTPTEYLEYTEQQICDDILNKWISEKEDNTGAVLYCVSALGLEHLHCVFESKKSFRPLNVLKRLFPKIHIEPTKGNKKQVEDYINKTGQFEEKGEKILAKSQNGEIIGCQGKRNDLLSMDEIKTLIENGSTPKDIFNDYPSALKSQNAVNYMFFQNRASKVPIVRDVYVQWLCGRTGCGKSYIYVELCQKYGEENVYLVSDYNNPFDNYIGEDVIVFDEFRGQPRLAEILMWLDVYKREIRARYANKVALWTKVYITSPVTPYEVYNKNSDTTGSNDRLQQLYRRVNHIVQCFNFEVNDYIYYFKVLHKCGIDETKDGMYSIFRISKAFYLDKLRGNNYNITCFENDKDVTCVAVKKSKSETPIGFLDSFEDVN